MKIAARATLAAVAALLVALPAMARFARVPANRVDEVPIERLLSNLKRNTQGLLPDQQWRAIGRVHLLAYVRASNLLPAYRHDPGRVAEGKIGECAEMDKQAMGEPDDAQFPRRRPGDLCEARRFSLKPRLEVPREGFARPRAKDVHLYAALDAYRRAKKLDPENLRTRLALAFVLDRLNRLGDARAELRPIVLKGLQLTPQGYGYSVEPPPMDGDLHTVLGEAADHLALIPEDGADRQDAVLLKQRLKNTLPSIAITPILVPLRENALLVDIVDPASRVKFDFTGQGLVQRSGWLKPDAGWLVWDPRRRGKIVSGFQLFGSVTWLAFWDNGYHALGSLDDDGDGKIAGSELEGLSLWRDRNSNGVSERGEVKPVTAHGIVALSYAHERVREDLWLAQSGVTFKSGEVRPTYDWVVRPAPVVVSGR